MHNRIFLYLLAAILFPALVTGQQTSGEVHERCATMEKLQLNFKSQPGLKERFEQERTAFTKAVKRGTYKLAARETGDNQRTIFTIPIVFHVVATNPDIVTEASIMAQLDVLNKYFSGTNADSTKIPSYFKPLFGKSGIQFCLAQRTPTGEATTGIDRVKTTETSFFVGNNSVKNTASGGANSWDTRKYFNVWLCSSANDVVGSSTFPSDNGAPEYQGVVVDYRTLPGGTLARYNSGKTLVHETGHYFDLYHTWGDENADANPCTGSDFIDDTPNQASATTGCHTGIKTDTCTRGGNGIMYQNLMDYSYDTCMVMFTLDQVARMESAVVAYRSSLLTSNGCVSPVVRNFDARLSSVNQPATRLCSSAFTPAVTIKNQGVQELTSFSISTRIDNGAVTLYNWKGSLATLASTNVSLNNLNAPTGLHTLTIYVSAPNNRPDEDATNDTIRTTFQFYNAVTTVSEGFESATFPQAGWDIVNPDNNITWKRVTGIAKTGSASVKIDNFNYTAVGETDDLRLPTVTFENVDSAFLSFQVAAALYSVSTGSRSAFDTLQVLASVDCGQTYTSLYKKFGNDLITRKTATTSDFVPTASEWRKDSVNLASVVGQGNVLLAIRNINGFENNIYLDDINLRTVLINPNLKRTGFLVTPNPTNGMISVQFYPAPVTLRAIQVFTIAGQKISEVLVNEGQGSTTYRLNLTAYPAGIYLVKAVFTDRTSVSKVMKF